MHLVANLTNGVGSGLVLSGLGILFLLLLLPLLLLLGLPGPGHPLLLALVGAQVLDHLPPVGQDPPALGALGRGELAPARVEVFIDLFFLLLYVGQRAANFRSHIASPVRQSSI